ncbi:hypothetical protein HYE67_002079 [Fusarium culmorum]|uniref:Uncharacterized protein n=1 Tax=Fusarium culmorum TaxID=5516 RepID=A0A2T4GWX7_FUSCU|nr:hypothetical protein FCULG_00006275 [Fusarium culmorum]QPC59848.1 hypothetical protein HYE67_002079 [Fusarium culmorum]
MSGPANSIQPEANIIVRNIFALYDRIESPQQRAIQLYRALELALSHLSLPLSPLEYAFTKFWALLRDDGMEEILYPAATRLALRLSEKGHAQEQKQFLERIWNAEVPYEVENYRRRSPNLIPIAEMLQELSEGCFREAIRTKIYELEQVKKRSRPYFIHVRKDQIVHSIWEECDVKSLTAFLLPQSKRVAKLSFTEGRTPFQPPVMKG